MKERQDHALAVVACFSAVILAGILLLMSHVDRTRSVLQRNILHPSVQIAVENQESATLNITESEGKQKGIVELRAEGKGPIGVSVPATWELREVRGAALDAVPRDPLSLGFIRWHLPPNVTVSFWVTGTPAITVRHPSTSPLLISAKRIDLEKNTVDERSVLAKEGTVTIW